jgi:hypothetical protein
VPILELMFLTMDRNLQQIKCEPRGRNLCSISVSIMDKTSAMNCKIRHPDMTLGEPMHTDDDVMIHGVREIVI